MIRRVALENEVYVNISDLERIIDQLGSVDDDCLVKKLIAELLSEVISEMCGANF